MKGAVLTRKKIAGAKTHQIRLAYWCQKRIWNEEFWTTKWIAQGLLCNMDTVEFEQSLKALNPVMRYRAGVEPKDWKNNLIRARDLIGPPVLAGLRETTGQENILNPTKLHWTVRYLLPPLNLPPKKEKSPSQTERLFDPDKI